MREQTAARAQKGSLRYDPVLLSVVVALAAFGVVMVYSASAVYAGARLGDGLWFFKRQALGAGLGLAALFAAMKIGYRRLEAFESEEVARVPMSASQTSGPVENFTISFDQGGSTCSMKLSWEKTEASVQFSEKK